MRPSSQHGGELTSSCGSFGSLSKMDGPLFVAYWGGCGVLVSQILQPSAGEKSKINRGFFLNSHGIFKPCY